MFYKELLDAGTDIHLGILSANSGYLTETVFSTDLKEGNVIHSPFSFYVVENVITNEKSVTIRCKNKYENTKAVFNVSLQERFVITNRWIKK